MPAVCHSRVARAEYKQITGYKSGEIRQGVRRVLAVPVRPFADNGEINGEIGHD